MGFLITLAALPARERRAAFEAAAELVRARTLVALVPPRRWWRAPDPVTHGASSATDPVREVRDAVNRAQRRLPLISKCLPQALAAQRMLARRGVAAALTLGTARASAPGEDRFHAWCKVGDRWVTGDCDEAAYAVMAPPRA